VGKKSALIKERFMESLRQIAIKKEVEYTQLLSNSVKAQTQLGGESGIAMSICRFVYLIISSKAACQPNSEASNLCAVLRFSVYLNFPGGVVYIRVCRTTAIVGIEVSCARPRMSADSTLRCSERCAEPRTRDYLLCTAFALGASMLRDIPP
jgi:hypothetical protein